MTMESMEYGISMEEQAMHQLGTAPDAPETGNGANGVLEETALPGQEVDPTGEAAQTVQEAGGDPEAAPKKKRASRKKAEKAGDAAAVEASSGSLPLESPEEIGRAHV